MNIAAGGGVPLSKSGIYPDILETFTHSAWHARRTVSSGGCGLFLLVCWTMTGLCNWLGHVVLLTCHTSFAL